MKGVLLEVTEADLARRRLLGLDRWDEMWEGVLHMAPAPMYEHQRVLDRLIAFLLPLIERRGRGTLVSGVNVFNEASRKPDYRIPDLTFVAAGHEGLIAEDGIRRGGPDAVVEIRSPEDETYDKFPFFAALGVREVIVIPRDTKQPEVYRLAGRQYVAVAPGVEGWVVSEVLGVRFRLLDAEHPVLRVQDATDPSAQTDI